MRLELARRARAEDTRRADRHLDLGVVGHRDLLRRRIHHLVVGGLHDHAQLQLPGRRVERAHRRPRPRSAMDARRRLIGHPAAEHRASVGRQGRQRHVGRAGVAGAARFSRRRGNRLPDERDAGLPASRRGRSRSRSAPDGRAPARRAWSRPWRRPAAPPLASAPSPARRLRRCRPSSPCARARRRRGASPRRRSRGNLPSVGACVEL